MTTSNSQVCLLNYLSSSSWETNCDERAQTAKESILNKKFVSIILLKYQIRIIYFEQMLLFKELRTWTHTCSWRMIGCQNCVMNFVCCCLLGFKGRYGYVYVWLKIDNFQNESFNFWFYSITEKIGKQNF